MILVVQHITTCVSCYVEGEDRATETNQQEEERSKRADCAGNDAVLSESFLHGIIGYHVDFYTSTLTFIYL